MNKPNMPKKGPYKVTVEQGKIYFWCSCGLSIKQPFCDGSHKKENKFKSIKFEAVENKDIYLCGCKLTNKPPFCDGTHSK